MLKVVAVTTGSADDKGPLAEALAGLFFCAKLTGMGDELIYGWIVTVDVPGTKASQVYNVAIREERKAIEAVKLVLPERNKGVVKIRSKITKQLFEALRMQPGDVMLGVRKKHPR